MSSSGVNLEKYLIPLDEINSATEYFSRERYIGGGGFGSVYKGQLSERWQNRIVAVKRLDADSHQGGREFRNEIELISRFHHENVISFIGYCDEGVEMIIVYEYASNGSLDHHLQDPNKMFCITWAQRLKICIGAARGLHYLHSGLGGQDRIIHRDVKSANILLDGNMVAKICDFGLSKLGTRNQPNQPDTRLYTKVAGTQFYLDPSYLESGILQKESDIYSFGVVLFEVVSGMLVYGERRIGDERQSLINTVRRYYREEPETVMDPYIRDRIKSSSFYTFHNIAYKCISLDLTERPTLDTVIKTLEKALISQFSEAMVIPADSSRIESHMGNLNSIVKNDWRMASYEISFLTKESYENCVAFAKAGAIPRLSRLLTTPDSRTREHAVTALLNLSLYEDNKGIIISSGAIPGIVHMLEKSSNYYARENAAGVIFSLSNIDEAKVAIGFVGAIPPLVLMLSKGTPRGKPIAANSLNNLCKDYDNKGMAVRAGLVPVLMELLTEPQGVLKEESVKLLYRLSWHPKGKLAIGEAEAVPHLVEVLRTGSTSWEADAVEVLVNLCSMDQKYLVEAQEHGVMGKLEDVRHHGNDRGKTKARKLRRMIKDHQHVDYGSDTEDVGVADESVMFEPDPTDSWLVAIAKRISLICNIITTHSCIR